jgi:hypothetical protein
VLCDIIYTVRGTECPRKKGDFKMTIREYFETIEDLETRWAEEGALWDAMQDLDFDLDGWAETHGVDLEATDERLGEYVLTLWSWDMCGE